MKKVRLYTLANNKTKRAVSNAKSKAYDMLYVKIGSKRRKRCLAKAKKKKERGLGSVRCITDEDKKC